MCSLWDRALLCSALVSAQGPTGGPFVATVELSCVWSLPGVSQWHKHQACPPTCLAHNYQWFSFNKRIFHGKTCFKITLVSESVLAVEHPASKEGEHGAVLHFQFWFGSSYIVLK